MKLRELNWRQLTLWLSITTLLSLVFRAAPAGSTNSDPVYCDVPDSATVADSALTWISSMDAVMHPFGADTLSYPNEFAIGSLSADSTFSKVFDLYLTDSVSARWTQSEWHSIINAILDGDADMDDDIFGRVWSYFLRADADADPAYAGVEFTIGGKTYTKIQLKMFDTSDLGCPCSAAAYGSKACAGHSYPVANELFLNASDYDCPPPPCACAPISAAQMLGQGVAHELQHICFNANGQVGYEGVDESLATLAEYLEDSWRPLEFDLPYDASFVNGEACDVPRLGSEDPPKYQTYKSWMIYLYETFRGDPSDPTDDLVYRWINNDAAFTLRLKLPALATELWDSEFAWVGGTSAWDRLSRTYANYLAAKFCNAPIFGSHGEYGIGPTANTVRDLGFFLDNCDWYAIDGMGQRVQPMSPVDCPPQPGNHLGCWNVRVLAPDYDLTDDNENVITSTLNLYPGGIYHDGDAPLPADDGDHSKDYIDVYQYGTDYVIFRADEYFDDGQEHDLKLRVKGKAITNNSNVPIQPVGWVIAYSTASDTLQVHPEDILFVKPLTFTPSTAYADTLRARTVVVTDFGRSVKSVVLALGAGAVNQSLSYWVNNGFVYNYSFGVLTPTTSTRTWDGDVYVLGDVNVVSGGALNIAAGTMVNVFDSDLGETGDEDRIEFNVNGGLVADGSEANPIVFEPWSSSGLGNWLGFLVNDTSSGATFDHCVFKRAAAAIRSYAPLTVTHTEIDTCAWSGIVSKDGGMTISNCQLRAPGYVGIEVDADANTVRNTFVDGALLYAVSAYDSASTSLDIRGSELADSDTGLYVSGNVDVDIDSTCCFYQNDTGIHFYNSGTAATVRGAGITWSTSAAIHCDNSSSPRIDSSIFAHNGAGIYCTNSSSPVIESNEMQMSGNAVSGASSSYPDVGHSSPTSGQSAGNNKIAHNSKSVVNGNGSGTISAQNNYWNTTTSPCTPSSGLFTGSVDHNYPVCPGSFPRWVGTEGEPEFEEWGLVYQVPGGSTPDGRKPLVTGLTGIVPNPFNPETTIQYSLRGQSKVDIKIYDVAGRLVDVLASETQVAGQHSVVWRGTDRRGSSVASGVYFVRMIAGSQVFTKKMVLLK